MPDVTLDDARAFPVVGIGASAGGLRALESFFRATPPEPGMAFVVIMHGAGQAEPARRNSFSSYRHDGRGRARRPSRREGQGLCPAAQCSPDHFRGNPAASADGRRPPPTLADRRVFQRAGPRPPRTRGWHRLVRQRQRRVWASRRSKRTAASPLLRRRSSGGFASMPESAIASGLSISPFPSRTCRRASARSSGLRPTPWRWRWKQPLKEDAVTDERDAIYAILRSQTGHDFSGYKIRTFLRRVHRRMQILDSPPWGITSSSCARTPTK